MKIIIVAQRVDAVAPRGERRDALDQRWATFLRATGGLALPVPNDRAAIAGLLAAVPPDGILLTGGNSPADYGGTAPERDEADVLLLDYALRHQVPLIGVCRGMQSVLQYFGSTLAKVSGHTAVRHWVDGEIRRTVNSFHDLAGIAVPLPLNVTARAEDGVAEAVRHSSLPIFAMMWHPEREAKFSAEDIGLFRAMWDGKPEVACAR